MFSSEHCNRRLDSLPNSPNNYLLTIKIPLAFFGATHSMRFQSRSHP